MKPFYLYSIRHPRQILLAGMITVMLMAPGLLRLELRTDGHALAPAGSDAARFDLEIRREFGIRDPIVVLLRFHHPSGVYDPQSLRLVQELTNRLIALPNLDDTGVLSLATEKGDRFRPGSLDFRYLLEPFPETERDLALLRADVQALDLYVGTLVSYDEKAAAIFVGVPEGANRLALFRAIKQATDAVRSVEMEIDVIGAPVAEALLGNHILQDLGIPAALLGPEGRGPDLENGGFPRSWYEFRLFIARHVGLLPIGLIVMALVFLVAFRSPTAVLLPLVEIGACLVTVFGLMGWLGVPVYLTTAVLPVILTAVAVADEIHIFTRYSQLRSEDPDRNVVTTVRAALEEMRSPVVKTSITTVVGFLSFAMSPLAPVRSFGVFAALGILFCMLWSFTVIPSLLVLLAPRGSISPLISGAAAPGVGSWLARFGVLMMRTRWPVIWAAALLVAVSLFGLRQLRIQDSWIGGFASESAFREAIAYFDRQFFGTHTLLAVLEKKPVEIVGEIKGKHLGDQRLELPPDLAEDPADLEHCRVQVSLRLEEGEERMMAGVRASPHWRSRIEGVHVDSEHVIVTTRLRDGSPRFWLRPEEEELLDYEIRSQWFATPAVLREVERFEEFLEAQSAHSVGGVLGPAEYIATTHFIQERRAPGSRRIPEDAKMVESLWGHYARVRGAERQRELVDENFSRAVVTVFLKSANFVDTARLMSEIRDYEKRALVPKGVRVKFAGDVAISQSLIDAIVTTQVRSLLISLIGVFLVAVLLSRSARWGAYAIIPCALAVMALFAAMGLFAVPLGVATAMFAGMTLGIGVDFSVHLVDRIRVAELRGLATEIAVRDALEVAGPAILVDALAVALGFGVLTLSQVPANQHLGMLTVLCVSGCLLVTIVLLPVLVVVGRPRN